MARKKLPLLPLVLGVSAICLGGWWVKSHFFPAKAPANYITAPVTRADINNTVLASGTITAFHSVDVGAQVSGQIDKLAVKLGDRVTAGQLIGEIDPRTAKNSLQNAQASLNSAKAQLAVRTASVEKARLDFNRQQAMLASNATSKENFDNAQIALKTAEAEILQAQAQIEQAQISVETAKLNLGYTRIVAPVDGVVVSVPVEEGQTVNANQTTPTIVTIAELDTVTIKAEISEGDITRVKPGMKATFTILSEPDRVFETKLRSIDPGPQSMSDKVSGSSSASSSGSTSTAIYYYGLLDVPNADGTLRIDMTAQVSIHVEQSEQALTIPIMALNDRPRDGMYMVSVLTAQGKLERRRVKIGLQNQIHAEVLEGLAEGDEVVISQADGSSVRPGGPQGQGPRVPGQGRNAGGMRL